MRNFDDIVVGSGISGLTMALILGMNGRKVLLLEKAPAIGGSIARFSKQGIPFDTGFHFTGGLQKDGIMHNALKILGIRDMIEPVFLPPDNANCFYFESENKSYEMPYGIDNVIRKLKGYFPEESSAIDRYFMMVQDVCDNTPSMDFRRMYDNQTFVDEDFLSLDDVLDKLTGNGTLKALLSGFAMCHGVKPGEISFANHSRICQGLYQSVARISDGGRALINAFKEKFKKYDIEIKCNTYISEMADIKDRRVGRFLLSNGEEVYSDNCILTIHPKGILEMLPPRSVSKAFVDRVSSFESSAGFFSLFAVLDPDSEGSGFGSSIFSIFPHDDVNKLLTPDYKGSPALVLVNSVENVRGKTYKTINAFEVSFWEHVKEWESSARGKRPQAYSNYKQERVNDIVSRILNVFPQYEGRLKVIESASLLTFRDYLHSPDGSAYGIKQKVNQFNLLGKLPIHNLYAAGQSSLLPGVIGAMMSSFIVGRSIVDESMYSSFLTGKLDS